MAGLLLGVAAYARFVADTSELTRIRGDGLATVAYIANWRAVFAHESYWDLFAAPSPLQHMWSVAIEEQFYLLWPLVIIGLLRWRGRQRLAASVLVTSLVLAACSLATMVLLYDPSDTTRVYFGTDARAASILVGVAFAAWRVVRSSSPSARARSATQAVGLAGAALTAYAWTHAEGTSEWLYRGGMFGLAVVAVAVIAAITSPEPGLLGRALSVAPLRWLGLISYGTYLWHWPVYLVLSPDRTGIDGWPLVLLRLAATLVVAVLSYVVVEQPIRRGTLRRVDLRVASPLAAVVVVLALLVGTSGATSAAPVGEAVLPDEQPEATAAIQAAAPGAERIMVTGNSVGLYLGQGMQDMPTDRPMVAVNRSLLGCTFPLPDDIRLTNGERCPQGRVDCTATWAEDVEALQPDVVVVAFNDPGDADYLHDGRWLHPCMPEYDSWLREEWHRRSTSSAPPAPMSSSPLPVTPRSSWPPRSASLGPTAPTPSSAGWPRNARRPSWPTSPATSARASRAARRSTGSHCGPTGCTTWGRARSTWPTGSSTRAAGRSPPRADPRPDPGETPTRDRGRGTSCSAGRAGPCGVRQVSVSTGGTSLGPGRAAASAAGRCPPGKEAPGGGTTQAFDTFRVISPTPASAFETGQPAFA